MITTKQVMTATISFPRRSAGRDLLSESDEESDDDPVHLPPPPDFFQNTIYEERPSTFQEGDVQVLRSVGSPSIPRPKTLGLRTTSTEVRLRRQGFTTKANATFAVQSIRRGSEGWRAAIKPFVADLVFRSLERRRYQSEISFRPYTCHAAVLFIDMASYSKITAMIAPRGAHAISAIVNAYLSRILRVVHKYGGDVVKFAGDAVLVVWEGDEDELGMNVLCAAECVVALLDSCDSHKVEGTSLSFRVHCGLTCGGIESEIFAAPAHVNMQRLYHSVGGDCVAEICDLVDIAKAGEVCVSMNCLDYLDGKAMYSTTDVTLPQRFCDSVDGGSLESGTTEGSINAKILKSLNLDHSTMRQISSHIDKITSRRLLMRNKEIEEEFIHPSVIRLLSHGGFSPTQIAQMRNLCVLFIAMTASGSSVNWLMEVQGVLDRHHCVGIQVVTASEY